MTDAEVLALLQQSAKDNDGRVELDCETALTLAARVGRAPAEIGKMCNDRNIRIRACQLGCFP